MIKIKLVLIICLFIPLEWVSAKEASQVDLKQLAKSTQWLRLMHYGKGFFVDHKGKMDGLGFYFSPKGKTDPYAELIASREAMSKDIKVGKLKIHPQCAFPFRYQFLKSQTKLDTKNVPCPKFNSFIEGFNDPASVSIVYSSAYPNNPASMFGHLLLKFNSERNNPLMDAGLNYAAVVPDDENSLAFIYFGLSGGYVGQFSNLPYYVKVNKYSNFESRDIWEYELELTKNEAYWLLAHIWEMEVNSHYQYYFFDENCAYQLMAAIEVVKPEWNIAQHNIFYAMPGEMIKNLTQSDGIVRDVHFRPSHFNKATQYLDSLNAEEERDFEKLIDKTISVNKVKNRLALDATIHYIEYLRNEEKSNYQSNYQEFRKKLLSARSKLGILSDDEKSRIPEIPKETRPDEGHDASSIIPGFGYQKALGNHRNQEFLRLKIKSAFHDLLNNDRGLTRYGQIEFPSIEFRYFTKEESLQVEEVGLIKTMSLHPLSRLSSKPSWKFQSAWIRAKDYGCTTCKHLSVAGGGGGSLNIGPGRSHLAYFLATLNSEAYENLSKGYRLGPGLDIGFLFNPGKFKLMAAFQRKWFVLPQPTPNAHLDFIHTGLAYHAARNWEIRQTAQWTLPSNPVYQNQFETFLSIFHFFN